MSTQLPQPGVEILQQFRTVSPTVISPTLVPCVVAPAFQVIDAMITDGSGSRAANADAVASLVAVINSDNGGLLSGLDGLTLLLSISDGPEQTFVFADPTDVGLTPQQLADQIASSIPAPAGFGAYTDTVDGVVKLQLRTIAKGDTQSIKIGAGTANTVLGFAPGYQVTGSNTYKQSSLVVPPASFPDPRGILDELAILDNSIRVFVNTGRNLKEMLRTSAFLRRNSVSGVSYTGGAITFALNPSGRRLQYRLTATGELQVVPFTAGHANASPATASIDITGTVCVLADASNPFSDSDLGKSVTISNAVSAGNNGTFVITAVAADGSSITYTNASGVDETFTGVSTSLWAVSSTYATIAGLVAAINSAAGFTFVAASSNALVFTSPSGYLEFVPTSDASIEAATILGVEISLTGATHASLQAVDDGGTTTTTPFVGATGQDFTAAAGHAVVTGTTAITTLSILNQTFQVSLDGGPMQEITVPSSSITLANLVALINATMGTGFASSNVGTNLVLTSSSYGEDSVIKIGRGTANTALGFTDGQTVRGASHRPVVGDTLFGDGLFVGNIVQVASGGVVTRLKLDRKVSKSYGAASWYIQANNIPSDLPITRPLPDMYVDSSGTIHLKHDFLRDTIGVPVTNGSGSILIAYKALRLDVSPSARNPALLTFDGTDSLTAALSPVNLDNPLALMLYFSLINATGISVCGLGVDGVSAADPDGTPEAYSRATSFLEAQEVYALVPGSQNPMVHQIFGTHVTDMSEPSMKGERIVFINPAMPDEAQPTLVSSGSDGQSTMVLNEFDTRDTNLPADILTAGLNPQAAIPATAGLYLLTASSTKRYSISAVSGTVVTVRTTFAPGENTDGFYSTTALAGGLLEENFTVYVRGQALVTAAGKDYAAIAQAYQDIGQAYGNRRIYMVAPEKVAATVDGSEQIMPGYYLCAALAGMVGQLPPQQGFTNYPMTGFSRPIGSNDVFNNKQLDTAAAGGTFWVVQNTEGAPLMPRMQVSTNTSSIETRELSITKVVDFVAKLMRGGLRNFIGKFNITQPFLDTLSTVIQGQLSLLVERGVLNGADLNNIVQDAKNPDTVLIDVTLDVPYPCNYIRLTLSV